MSISRSAAATPFECRACVFGAFHRIGRDQRRLALVSLDGDGHALPPGQHQRLLPAKGDETLLFAVREVEALCHWSDPKRPDRTSNQKCGRLVKEDTEGEKR